MASTQNVFKSLLQNNKTTPTSNLTPKEHLMLKPHTEDLMFIIFMFMADTNLGPCIMERDRYILKALAEHLEKGNAYKCLTPNPECFLNHYCKITKKHPHPTSHQKNT